MSFHYKFLAALGLTLLVVSLQGCASTPENTRAMLSEEVRGSFRQVGIVTKGPEPAPEVLGTLGPVGDVAIGAGKDSSAAFSPFSREMRPNSPAAGRCLLIASTSVPDINPVWMPMISYWRLTARLL